MRTFRTNLKQPQELRNLMAAGLWPATHEQAIQQNLSQRIPTKNIHLLIPTEDRIDLYSDPSMTVEEEHQRSRSTLEHTDFFAIYGQTLRQIDPGRALLIADFGLGSDAPIALDLRVCTQDPPVICLKWDDSNYSDGQHQWVQLAPSFSEFVKVLQLWDLPEFKR